MKKIFLAVLLFSTCATFAQVQFGPQNDLVVTGQATQTAVVNNILTTTAGTAATDLKGFRSFSVQVVSTGTGGTYIFEGSNDNTSFVAVPVYNQLILTGTPITAAITATSSQIIYIGTANFRYLRLRIATTITGGSIRAFSKFQQASFTPNVFQVGQVTAANLNATVTGTVSANATPVTYATNATTTVNLNSAATTNATLVKATAGIVYTIHANNTTASAKYLRLYNLTTAPTVGTSTPVMVITIPASSSVTVPIGAVGLKFATGISYAITNAAAYLDATAVAAGDVQLLINYQ